MRDYVYILRCRDGSFYTGWTNRLPERIKAHNEGKGGAKCTRARRPAQLAYAECYPSKSEALAREWAVKRLTHERKASLIAAGTERTGGTGEEEDFVMGKIYYLMGKSATGKNKIYDSLLADKTLSLRPLVIYTTRPIRSGEKEGVEYHFTDEAGLAALEQTGRVIEKRSYDTACGVWTYFTVDDETIDLTRHSYLAIGTLASYQKLKAYYGSESVVGIYIESEDGHRLERALKREKKQTEPKYEEMCRRFLADQKDFSAAKLKRSGITNIFNNDRELEDCIREITSFIMGE